MNEPAIIHRATSQIQVEKHRANSARWRKLNREKALASTKAWKAKNAEKIREYQKKYNADYRQKKLSKLRAQDREKYARNRNKYIANTAAWRKKYPERKRFQSAAWYKLNCDKIRAKNFLNRDKIKERDAIYRKTPQGRLAAINNTARRRARKAGCLAIVTTMELLQIKKSARGKCFYCRKRSWCLGLLINQ